MLARNFLDLFSVLVWESVMGLGIIKNSKNVFQNDSELTKSVVTAVNYSGTELLLVHLAKS